MTTRGRIMLTGTATCAVCGMLAAGDPGDCDKQAAKHTRTTGHATLAEARPA